MIFKKIIAISQDNKIWLLNDTKMSEVLTITSTCKQLKKSRRHIYRYIKQGNLKTYGKYFGEWLIDKESIMTLLLNPMGVQPIPGRMELLLPEYEIKKLNRGKDASIIICRILNDGNIEDIKWLNKNYKLKRIKEIIERHGSRLLSKRTLNFWKIILRINPNKLKKRKGSLWEN